MAAGTAAALVPIRSITRRIDAAAAGKSLSAAVGTHERLMVGAEEETVTYIPASQPDAGEHCLRLLSTLQGIQLGKLDDPFGWCVKIQEADLQVEREE